MKTQTIIIYDLNDKTNVERTRILQLLFSHREKSNYNYTYQRKGLLNEFKIIKTRKTVLFLKNKKDLSKISEIFKNLKVNFEIAKIQ